ncbi:V-ATPase subunit [Intoshia linei]|uniref:V-type proton ATPase subunit a n=1 Tax=Intoshia linei TaxID=1819745 RepID=A0A177AUS5_9BILA|nr:V-ATPase subunit [Intoshia linei]
MLHINQNSDALNQNYLELIEYKHLIEHTETFFNEALKESTIFEQQESTLVDHNLNADVEDTDGAHNLNFGFVTGVISNELMLNFEKMIWRVSYGNVFVKKKLIEHTIEDPLSRSEVQKVCFVLFFQGVELKKRIKKVCQGFHATLYPCPEKNKGRRDLVMELTSRIEELSMILDETQTHKRRISITAAKHINEWFVHVLKIKYIYHTLNMCNYDVTRNCLIAECWLPSADYDSVKLATVRGTNRSGTSMPSILHRIISNETPPTFHKSNKYTEAYQTIVDAYGVATYREVNPATFSIITFPFLFAVMFGDMGHGILMTAFALVLVLMEKRILAIKKRDEVFNILFGGRYIILLMGIFSIFTGFIYNDIFSKSLNIFGTSWNLDGISINTTKSSIYLNPYTNSGNSTYPVGMDPIWQLAGNKLSFINSYKMKMSIIFGFVHMMFGISLGLINNLYFDQPINIFCMFIPQVIFITSLFGYLVCLLFYKWIYITAVSESQPSLLVEFITMMLFNYPKNWQEIYPGQKGLQTFLVLLALICIPWMLFSKLGIQQLKKQGILKSSFLSPKRGDGIKSINRNKSKKNNDSLVELLSDESRSNNDSKINMDVDHINPASQMQSSEPTNESDQLIETKTYSVENKEDMMEDFIYQGIHVIEYCLGVISNMASYLRLWALSLAHAQLSEVCWQRLLSMGLKTEGILGMFVLVFTFSVWAICTLFILLLMEGLSAFLHSLRLHWVEFQNKFYDGKGQAFIPFSFKSLLAEHANF